MDDLDTIASSLKAVVNQQGNFMEQVVEPAVVAAGEPAPSTEEINNPKSLGVSTRIKDIALVCATTGITGYLALRSNSPTQLFATILPLHACMLYGITSSYFATRKLALAFTATGTVLTSGVVVGLSTLLNFQSQDNSLLFKPLSWFIENIAIKRITEMVTGSSDVLIAPESQSDGERLSKLLRFAVAVVVTATAGVFGSIGSNVFRALTAKAWY